MMPGQRQCSKAGCEVCTYKLRVPALAARCANMAVMLSTFASAATSRRVAGARHCGQTALTASDCAMQLLQAPSNCV